MTRHPRCLTTIIAAFVGAWLALTPFELHAATPLPSDITVPAGHKLYLRTYAVGTQNYVCVAVPSPDGLVYAWRAFGPQATLFDGHALQLTTHFLSANPDEDGTARPTWQSSRDSSTVWANPVAATADPSRVEPGAIPWLLLEVVGTEPGPTHGRHLLRTRYIQRVQTSGGVMPTEGCDDEEDIGDKVLVPYSTEYLFYRAD